MIYTQEQKEYFMRLALKEAEAAYELGEVPVGAVIVWEGEAVASAHNLRETEKNALYHAELLAINEACKKLGGWRLHKGDLFVTLEPCFMCAGACVNARIRNVYYLLDKPSFKNEYNKTNYKKVDYPQSEKCHEILRNFFNKIR